MSYLDQAVQAHKDFRRSIAAQAKPDNGIQLKHSRGVKGKQAELERRQRIEAAKERHLAEQRIWLQKLLEQPRIVFADDKCVVTDVNLRCHPPVTVASVGDYMRRAEPYVPLRLIKRIVCEHFSITIPEITGQCRQKNLTFPRHIAFYIAKELTLRSLPEIGREFGNRDHTTVLHGRDKIKKQIENDEQLRGEIDKLIAKIRQEIRA